MGQFIQITPFMHVEDLGQALAIGVLGFDVPYSEAGYAYVEREGCGIRILQNDPVDGGLPGNRRFRYYIDVRDVDALHAELGPRLETLPAGHVHGPADKPYRQRELLVRAPDGNLIAFGQAIAPAAGSS